MLLGPIIVAVIIVIVLPVLFLLTGGIIAAITGHFLTEYGKSSHEGSELIDLNK